MSVNEYDLWLGSDPNYEYERKELEVIEDLKKTFRLSCDSSRHIDDHYDIEINIFKSDVVEIVTTIKLR